MRPPISLTAIVRDVLADGQPRTAHELAYEVASAIPPEYAVREVVRCRLKARRRTRQKAGRPHDAPLPVRTGRSLAAQVAAGRLVCVRERLRRMTDVERLDTTPPQYRRKPEPPS